MPTYPQALQALADRWAVFSGKIRERVQAVFAEAGAAYQDVMAIDVVDGTALSGVSSALEARFHGLREKIDESWNKIDEEIDRAGDSIDDAKLVGRFRGELLRVKLALGREVERSGREFIWRREADAARGLHAKAMTEVGAPLACSQCGAGLHREMWHKPVNVKCPHCGAMTTATPGTAGALFVAGTGAIALAFEAAIAEWHALQDAEVQWHRLRHRTVDDLARFEQATRVYWTAFARGRAQWMPGWGEGEIAAEVQGKMGHFEKFVTAMDQKARADTTQALSAAASGDVGAVHAWARSQRDAGSAAEELLEAVVERGWGDLAKWLAPVVHPLVAEDEPRDAWVREKLEDLANTIHTRGD